MEQIFQKLVRDLIPDKIEKNGEVAVTRILEDEEYRRELYRKLLEEAEEVIQAPDTDSIKEELADVLEILKAIASLEKIPFEEVLKTQEQKRKKRGGFEQRVFLEKTFSQEDISKKMKEKEKQFVKKDTI